ncbi:hypothetical protein M9Y10_002078 [Tritrichomonas musculus]|uniref:Protein kinase domain-containing protein n=1 Tax=Tritrichomonas musculus TaxID=1915356 RepID=A0ABR2L8S7_9EUKA
MTQAAATIFTIPNIPVDEEGYDNVNGDLIVSLNYIIQDPRGSKYQVTAKLGAGQFGQVFHVVDITNPTVQPLPAYAMKVTKSIYRYRQQAQREVQLLTHVQSNTTPQEQQHISHLQDWFLFHNHVCIVIELLSFDLYEIIKRRRFRGLPLVLVQSVLKDMLEVLNGLERCGIIHCDIKPENILLADEYSQSVKMIDFGSSNFSNQPGSFYVQSRYYRAPEVVLGINYSFPIDIWSLGCVALELFTALPLFPGQNEVHLIELIVEMLGQFPDSMVQASTRRQEFFLPDGTLKSEEQICREKHIPVTRFEKYFEYNTLDEVVLNYDLRRFNNNPELLRQELTKRQMFINLLKGMLRLDPAQRLTAAQALQDPFITADLTH